MTSKADLAYEYLKSRIISGELPPLSSISEKEIQEQLSTSRTPVREALLRLHDLGFIYIYPNRGTIVSELSQDLIDEMYAARSLNEVYVNISAARHVDREYLQKLRADFLSRADAVAENHMFYVELDDALHDHLLEHCGNRFVRKSLQMVYDHNRRLRRFVMEPLSVVEHVEIIDAVLSQDEERIRTATLAHLDGSKDHTMNSFYQGELKFLHKR